MRKEEEEEEEEKEEDEEEGAKREKWKKKTPLSLRWRRLEAMWESGVAQGKSGKFDVGRVAVDERVVSPNGTQMTERQTDRQRDRQTERETDR